MYDYIIKNGLIADGTGAPAYTADIAFKDGKIAKIAPSIEGEATRVFDAAGLVVSPGFVDNHSHADCSFLADTDAYNYLEQGITCEVSGHCGVSAAPAYPGAFLELVSATEGRLTEEGLEAICDDFKTFNAHVDGMKLGTNMAFLAGQGNIRARVMGFSAAEPTEEQMNAMKALVAEAMENGAVGISTGLIYPPSIYAKTPELIELAKVVAQYGGVYFSHIRGEGDTLIDAVAEAIEIGEKAGCPVHISHLKVSGGKRNQGKSKIVLRMIDEANDRGVRVTADQYPYLAGATNLIHAMPPEYMTDGEDAFCDKLSSRAFRDELTAYLSVRHEGENFLLDCGFEGCLILSADKTKEYAGKNLAEAAQMMGKDPFEATYDLIAENRGLVGMAFFMQNEEDLMNILAYPRVGAGCDYSHELEHFPADTLGGGHPRGMATLTRHLRLVRENNLMPMEKAIYRVTVMAAEISGIPGIGYLREGYDANVCVFDWNTIGDTNSYLHPYSPNTGLYWVFVNGQLAVEDGKVTGVLAGKRLIKPVVKK